MLRIPVFGHLDHFAGIIALINSNANLAAAQRRVWIVGKGVEQKPVKRLCRSLPRADEAFTVKPTGIAGGIEAQPNQVKIFPFRALFSEPPIRAGEEHRRDRFHDTSPLGSKTRVTAGQITHQPFTRAAWRVFGIAGQKGIFVPLSEKSVNPLPEPLGSRFVPLSLLFFMGRGLLKDFS